MKRQTIEEKRALFAEITRRKGLGESVAVILKDLGVAKANYYNWAKKFAHTPKPKKRPKSVPRKLDIPIEAPKLPVAVFAFYGSADEVARLVRTLQ